MKALIVEDDPEIAYAISLIFQLSFPDVQLFTTDLGMAAVDLARAQAPDITILDLGLPDMDGLEVLRQIRDFSAMPIVIASARSEQGVAEKSAELGADGYVQKPFTHQDLLNAVQANL